MEKILYSVSQYAQKKKVSRQAILKAIKKGKIKAIRVGYVWIIPEN